MKNNFPSAPLANFVRSLVPSAAFLPSTKTRLLAVVLSLAGLAQVFGQPIITNQPQNQTNLAGTTATFSVGATGAEPLSYQWRSYANATSFTNILFGTAATLVLTNVQPTSRQFGVVVTNSGGSVTSSPLATLTVLTPPAITLQPAVQIMTVGATATFTVTATGTAPLAYQWRFNDANLADKTNRTFSLANVQLTNAGNYTVVVTNAFGSVTSRVAALMFTAVHRFAGITANPDHSISLNLAGVVPKAFAPYYDLYPLDASTNLVDWTPLAMLLRTNDSSAALGHLDSDATDFGQRFYRTPTNFFTTPFPKPSGPYPVGTFSRLLTDPSRTNRYNIRTNSSFMVQLWYPAEVRAGVLPDAYVEKKFIELNPVIFTSPSTVAQFVSHALPWLPLATNQTSYPVLIYSHSMTIGFRRQSTDKALELASHGYVVVAVDHMNTIASVFPNGQVVYGTVPSDRCDRASILALLDNSIKDLLFALDELNTNDMLLAGRMDLERLGAFGYSWGCVPVAEFCRIDARCKAVVLLDGGRQLQVPPDLNQLGLQKPFLSMNSTEECSDECPPFGPCLSASQALFAKATNDAFWCQIQDSTHLGFDDSVALINAPAPTPVSRGQSQALKACTLSFFDKYLKNQDDHLLDNPAAIYTNIINFQSK